MAAAWHPLMQSTQMTFRNCERHFLSGEGKGTERHCDVLKFNHVTGWLWRLASDRFTGWFPRQEQPMRNPLMGHQRDPLGTRLHATDLRFLSSLPCRANTILGSGLIL